jgi:hypothetical protein
MFGPPTYLYVDAYSPALGRYRNIPYDVVFDGTNGVFNLSTFGVAPINALDGSGRVIRTWHFNMTRYVQHVVNGTESAYDLRLLSPIYILDQYVPPVPNATPFVSPPYVYVNPTMVRGRVRLTGNTGVLDTNPRRLRLRIVYSKI